MLPSEQAEEPIWAHKLLTLRAKRGVGLIGEDTNARPTRPVTYAEISSGTEVGRTKPHGRIRHREPAKSPLQRESQHGSRLYYMGTQGQKAAHLNVEALPMQQRESPMAAAELKVTSQLGVSVPSRALSR